MIRFLLPCLLFISCGYCEVSANLNDTDEFHFKYHNYRSLTNLLKSFTAKHSNLISLYTIGQSIKKRELWVVKISVPNQTQDIIPNIKLVGNIHGNEAAGREILLHFLHFLVNGYLDGDEGIIHLLSNNIIHILPSLNPDGFENAKEGLCERGHGRLNSRGEDLNRNFPDYFQKNDRPRQPESLAISNWMNSTSFILSASLHGGAMVANYPFESIKQHSHQPQEPSISPDDDVFQHLAKVYAKTHPIMHSERVCPNSGSRKFDNGITNGAAWYPLTGGMQDYNYAFHGCMEITLEVSCCKYPEAKKLEEIWLQNRDALLKYCLQAGMGVKGVILDKTTGFPIGKARLIVQGRDMPFYSTTEGIFFRILLPGDYILQVTAENYRDLSVSFNVEHTKADQYPKLSELKLFLTNVSEVAELNSRFADYEEYNTVEETTSIKFQQSTESLIISANVLNQNIATTLHRSFISKLLLILFPLYKFIFSV